MGISHYTLVTGNGVLWEGYKKFIYIKHILRLWSRSKWFEMTCKVYKVIITKVNMTLE